MRFKVLVVAVILLFFVPFINAQEQKEVNVAPFSQVKFEGSAKWVLIPSGTEKVVLESSKEDVFDYINIKNEGNTLVISTTDKNKNITKLFKSVTINVYFTSISSVALSGAGSVRCEEPFSAGGMTATLRGTGNMYLDLNCSTFTGNMFGTGSLDVKGTATNAVVRVEGVGGFDGFDLVTNNMDVTVSGVGGARVHATNQLTATLNGVGSIRYKGDPESKNFDTNGLGNIKKADDNK